MKNKKCGSQISRYVCICILFAILNTFSVYADIYMYIDDDGGIHFTNVPTSDESKYVLYVKGKPLHLESKNSESRYDHIILEASDKYDIPFHLLKAIIKVESGFNPDAVSKKGAVGLMQIMPDTNKDLNISDLYNPRENIMGGTSYFKKLLNKFNGKLTLALAAYNAGPTIVDKLNDIPPYRETENYVRKVMTYYNNFK